MHQVTALRAAAGDSMFSEVFADQKEPQSFEPMSAAQLTF